MRTLLLVIGAVAILVGLIFVGQGMGYITYTLPHMKQSFMVGDVHWAYYGAALAFIGMIFVYFSRRGT